MRAWVPELPLEGEFLPNDQHLPVVTLLRNKLLLYLNHHTLWGLFVIAVWPTLINIRRKKVWDHIIFHLQKGLKK